MKKSKLKLAGLVSPGGLYNPVGKSASAVNKALEAEKSATLLKSKLTMERFRAGMKALAKKSVPMNPMKPVSVAIKKITPRIVIPKTGQLVKVSKLAPSVLKGSALGLGAVAGSAAYSTHRIIKARKEVDKAVEDTNKAVQQSAKNVMEMGAELRRRKQLTGMSLSERREYRNKQSDNNKLKQLEGLKDVYSEKELKKKKK